MSEAPQKLLLWRTEQLDGLLSNGKGASAPLATACTETGRGLLEATLAMAAHVGGLVIREVPILLPPVLQLNRPYSSVTAIMAERPPAVDRPGYTPSISDRAIAEARQNVTNTYHQTVGTIIRRTCDRSSLTPRTALSTFGHLVIPEPWDTNPDLERAFAQTEGVFPQAGELLG